MSRIRRVKKRMDQVLTDASLQGDSLLDAVLRRREWLVWIVFTAIGLNLIFGAWHVGELMSQGFGLPGALAAAGGSSFFNLGWVLVLLGAALACAAVRQPTPNAHSITLASAWVVLGGAVLAFLIMIVALFSSNSGWLAAALAFLGGVVDLVPRLVVASVLWLVWRRDDETIHQRA